MTGPTIPLSYRTTRRGPPPAPPPVPPPAAVGRATEYFIMFAFTIYSGALISTFRFARGEQQIPPGQSEISNTLSQLLILVVLSVFAKRQWPALRASVRGMRPYIGIVGLCLLSTLWSQYPSLTLRRCVSLVLCVTLGVFCSVKVGLDGTIRIVGRTMLTLSVLSILVYFLVPSIGHEAALSYSNAMRGVFSQKNMLGEGATLGIVCYAYRLLQQQRLSVKPVLAMLLMFVCIVLAKSATSLFIVTLMMLFVLGVASMRTAAGPMVVYLILATFAGVVFVAAVDPDLLFALIQRDASFTGRAPLWAMALRMAAARPLLGYGYSAFWNENSRAVQYIWQSIGWEPPSAHNGYIDIMLQIGLPGLLLYVWLWGTIIRRSVRAMRLRQAPEASWILMFMAVNMLLNLDEGPLPYPDQFTAMMPCVLLFIDRLPRKSPDKPLVRNRI